MSTMPEMNKEDFYYNVGRYIGLAGIFGRVNKCNIFVR